MRAYFFIFLLVASAVVFAQADLQIQGLEYSADTSRIVAVLYNSGSLSNSPVNVVFYDSGQRIGEISYSSQVEPEKRFLVSLPYQLAPGEHLLRAEIKGTTVSFDSSITLTTGSSNNIIVSSETYNLRASEILIGEVVIAAVLIGFVAFKINRIRRNGTGSQKKSKKKTEEPVEFEKEKKKFSLKLHLPRKNKAVIMEENFMEEEEKQEDTKMKEARVKEKPKIAEEPRFEEKPMNAEEPEFKEKPQPKEETRVPGGDLKVKDIIGLPRGTRAALMARLVFHDRIGEMYAYFLRDETGEIIGFSRTKIEAESARISGTVDYFLDEHTSLVIDEYEKC